MKCGVHSGKGWAVLGLLLWAGPCWGAGLRNGGISVERAREHIRVLAEEIGPRKTGTEADDRAIGYITGVLEAFGLPVEAVPVESFPLRPGVRVLARTVNVVGRLEGARPGTILIGAHHDSRNRRVPGALDDASGVAVVLEVARVLSREPPASTVLFVLFGAEEEGCIGSRHFVEHRDLSGLRLAITLDPVGRGMVFLAPFPRPPSLDWSRAIRRVQRRRHLRGVLVDPLFALAPRFIPVPHFADHAPFLEKGIPALNLSSQFDLWEYHTELDRIDRVEPETLAAAGGIVLGLVRRYDSDFPENSEDPHYLLIRLPGLRLFLPGRVLYAVSLGAVLLVLLLGFPASRRVPRGPFFVQMVRCTVVVGFLSGLALSGLFLSELLSEAWTGFRYPWYARQGLSLFMALSLGVTTTWMAVRVSGRILPVVQGPPYLSAACLLLLLETGSLLAFRLPEFAFLFVPPLAAVTCCFWTTGWGAGLLLLAGTAHLPGLLLPGSYRAAVRFARLDIPPWLGMGILLVLVLPLVLAFVGLAYHRRHRGIRGRRILTHPNTLVASLVAFSAFFATWVRRESYDASNRRTVRVREFVDLERGRTLLELNSQENLRGIRILDPFPETIDLGERSWSREVEHLPDLMKISAREGPGAEPGERAIRVSLDLARPANRLRVRFRTPGGFLLPEGSPAPGGETFPKEVPEMEWRYVHELSRLVERYSLRPANPGSEIVVEVVAEFEEDLIGLRLTAPDTVFYHRNRIRAVEVLPPAAPVAGSRRGAADGEVVDREGIPC